MDHKKIAENIVKRIRARIKAGEKFMHWQLQALFYKYCQEEGITDITDTNRVLTEAIVLMKAENIMKA